MRHAASLLLLVSLSVPAQQVTRLTLPPPDAMLAEEFIDLTWARELRDGRVIVTDGRDQRVVVADLRRGRVETVGRRGRGPGEYPRALPVWSIGGDSSVMIDGPGRWLLLDGARVVATLAPAVPAVAATSGGARGADTRGHVYSAPMFAGGRGPGGDSTALRRISRATGKVDTIATLKAIVPRQTSKADEKGFFSFSAPTLGMSEEPLPFPDGWVAVVRIDPYRVDWRSPDGRWTRGDALPVPRVRMDDREKRAYLARIAEATGTPTAPPESIDEWPATVPPFRSPAQLLAAPDGRVVIPRLASADHPDTRYDVVDRRGVLSGQLFLARGERLIGFGARSAYVAAADDDGIQRLRRHPWPPAAR